MKNVSSYFVRHLVAGAGLIFMMAGGVFAIGGFVDDHLDGLLNGWDIVGVCPWSEDDGLMKPEDDFGQLGYLLTKYPCSDNGTFVTKMIVDRKSGPSAGVVVRWTSENNFYFFTLKPANKASTSMLYYCKNTTDIGSGTVVANNFPVGTTFSLKVEVRGNQLFVSVDNVLKATITDAMEPNAYGRVGYAHSSQNIAHNTYFDSSSWVDAVNSPSTVDSLIRNPPLPVYGDIKVCFVDEAYGSTTLVKPRVYVENTGLIPLRGFVVYYYITVENNKMPVLEDYSSPNCLVSMSWLGDARYRVTLDYTGRVLAPGEITSFANSTSFGIHYDDNSPFDNSNDFSYMPSQTCTTNPNMPVFSLPLPVAAPGVVTPPVNPPIPLPAPQSLLSGLALPVVYQVYTLTVVNIHCYETESIFSSDHLLLDSKVDGSLRDSYRRHLNDGEDWALNASYMFRKQAVLTLTDDDWLDPDDPLGTVVISTTPGLNQIIDFTGHGSHYRVTYNVTVSDTSEPSVRTATYTVITLNNLRCSTTEDNFGEDEDRLTFVVDKIQAAQFEFNLNSKQDHYLNAPFAFESPLDAKVNLTELDNPSIGDENDDLGTKSLDLAIGDHSVKFRGSGFNYTLYYTISTVSRTVSIKSDEQVALDNFAASTKPGLWPHVDKNALINDITRKIGPKPNANLFKYWPNQQQTDFCGPAAIMYDLLKRDPLRYVDFCRKVFEEAKFNGRTRTLVVDKDQDVLKSKVPASFGGPLDPEENQADWMTMAFLRDEANWAWDVDANGNGITNGFTTPAEMETWIIDVLGFSNSSSETTWIFGEVSAIDRARQTIENKGGVSYAMIKSELIQNSTIPLWPWPDHWIAVIGGVVLDHGTWYIHDSGRVQFQFFTWGYIDNVNLSENKFESGFYGVALGE